MQECFSADNKKAIIEAGLDYILSTKVPSIPEVIARWQTDNPDDDYTHGQIWSQPSYTDGRKRKSGKPDSVTHFHYSHDRARRTRRGIDEQVAKAQRAVDGAVAIKRNRYIDLKAPDKKVNLALAAKHRALVIRAFVGYLYPRIRYRELHSPRTGRITPD